MPFHFLSTKPSIPLSEPLCTFRTSKAYLWGLVRQLLKESQLSVSNPLHILDAACHSLITRDMFPQSSFYYGLDISKSRLDIALKNKASSDILFMADLSKDLILRSCFDSIVSLNTMSHLSESFQLIAVNNLLATLKQGGNLFLNSAVSDAFHLSPLLSPLFSSITPVYFDSYRSADMEAKSLVNSSNVLSLLSDNEFKFLNDACFHQQILFICKSYKPLAVVEPTSLNKLRQFPGSFDKLISLNSLPNVSRINYPTDEVLFKAQFLSKGTLFLLSSDLINSRYGQFLVSRLHSSDISSLELTPDVSVDNRFSDVFILGLENEWCSDLNVARTSINNLRSRYSFSINLVFVSCRESSKCTPSVVLSDY